MNQHKQERTEKTLTTIIIDNPTIIDEDLEEQTIKEKEEKILYTTILIASALYLLTIISWG